MVIKASIILECSVCQFDNNRSVGEKIGSMLQEIPPCRKCEGNMSESVIL